jgi:hypothetical protein
VRFRAPLHTDRKKKVEVPFNSYAFVQLEEKDRNLVFNRQERSVIYLVGEAAIVRDEEITIKTGLALDKCDVSLEAFK